MFAPAPQTMTMGFGSGQFMAPVLPTPAYNPGKQVWSPGSPAPVNWLPQNYMNPVPWPSWVPTLNCMQSWYGFSRERPQPVVNNVLAPLYVNNMFVAGFVGKSQG